MARRIDLDRILVIAGLASMIGAESLLSQATPTSGPSADSLLQAHRMPMQFDASGFGGPGGEWLVSRARDARVTVLGEDHGVAEVPAIVSGLFRRLQPAGYRFLAIEVSPRFARQMERAVRADTLDALVLRAPESATFFALEEERRMLDEVVGWVGSPESDRRILLGLDQETHHGAEGALAYLAELLGPARRGPVDSIRKLELVRRGDRSARLLVRGDSAEFRSLGAAAARHPAASFVHELRASAEIYRLHFSGRGIESNAKRESLIKRNFARAWERYGTDSTRVLVKVGASHAPRGQKLSDPAWSLGNYLSEWAEGRGDRSFHVFLMAGPEALLATPDGPRPGGSADSALGSALVANALERGGTVFDLVPLRSAIARGAIEVSASLERIVTGFDAVVLLTGSTPATLPAGRQGP